MAKQIKKHGKFVLVLALTLALSIMYLAIPQTQAASIGNREMKISDSRPSQTGVTYDFEGDHSGSTIYCLEIVFCTSATGGCGDWGGDASSAVKGASADWSNWTYPDWTASGFTATRVLYVNATGETGGSDYSFSTASTANPSSAASYFGRVTTYSDWESCSTSVDSGVTAFAIISGVAVSATVAETLSFSISLVTNNDCDTAFGTLAGPDSLATSIAFGELTAGTFYHACQDLGISTNAGNGYNLTGQETTSLYDSNIPDTIDDAVGDSSSMTETATDTWSTSNYGFAYSCDNVSGTDCSLTATTFYRQFACISANSAECQPSQGDTATTVMSNSGVSSSTSTVEYKVRISGTQAAGNYSNTVVYIATPTF